MTDDQNGAAWKQALAEAKEANKHGPPAVRILPPFPVEFLDLPDDGLAEHFFAWWLCFQAERRGIPAGEITLELAEGIRAATVDLDTDTERRAGLEKALRLIAAGETTRGGNIIRQHFANGAVQMAALDEAVTGRRRQREISKRSRRDPLQQVIIEVMGRKPEITVDELWAELKNRERGGVIDEIDECEDKIHFIGKDGKGGKMAPKTGLKDRMSRARKLLSSL